jgi:hypothetical protein
VDHPASSPELVRPWRAAAMVVTAIAGIELVLLVVAGIMLLGRSLGPQVEAATAHRAQAAKPAAPHQAHAPAPSRPSPVPAVLPRTRTRVIVLNGNGVQGAASEAASLAQARGYVVEHVGNAPRTGYARTLVMYRPGRRAEAVRLRGDLNRGVVTPLDGMKPSQLHGAQLVLILGTQR